MKKDYKKAKRIGMICIAMMLLIAGFIGTVATVVEAGKNKSMTTTNPYYYPADFWISRGLKEEVQDDIWVNNKIVEDTWITISARVHNDGPSITCPLVEFYWGYNVENAPWNYIDVILDPPDIYPGDYDIYQVDWKVPKGLGNGSHACIMVKIIYDEDPDLTNNKGYFNFNILPAGTISMNIPIVNHNSVPKQAKISLKPPVSPPPPEWDIWIDTDEITVPANGEGSINVYFTTTEEVGHMCEVFLEVYIDDELTQWKTIRCIRDETSPTLEIIRPQNKIYLFNRELFSFGYPLTFGPLTLEVDAEDEGIEWVEWYVDGDLVKADHNPDTFEFTWDEPRLKDKIGNKPLFEGTPRIGWHTITVTVRDYAYNSASQTVEVFKLF